MFTAAAAAADDDDYCITDSLSARTPAAFE